jgi:alpha-mannosidase
MAYFNSASPKVNYPMSNSDARISNGLPHSVRWTAQKIAQRLKLIEPLVYRRRQLLPPFRALLLNSPLDAPPVGPDVDDSQWQLVEHETYWGRWYTDFVLRTYFRAPDDWEAGAPLALYLPLGESGDFSHPEALAYVDGEPFAACDRHHQEILIPARWRDRQKHLLALHGWTGLGGAEHGEWYTQLFMRSCFLVQIDQPLRDFVAAVRVALGASNALDENEPAQGRLLTALDEAFTLLDTREPFGEEFYASVAPAHAALRQGIARAGSPLDVEVFATGHAHIDVAWLWTLGQTRRKAGRTFHNVMRLMDQFPGYHFTQSQPQLYEFVRQDDPALFEAIKARVAQGRWEPIGGMWVEADCNISGPESLVRQLLLGRSFFRRYFGADAESPVLWLPDVFGYSWALPQLIKQAGLDYFFTIKIGWSQYNRLPYDSFWWQGLDGTRVLTHFSPTPDPSGAFASTYNAEVSPQQVLGTWTNFQQKDLNAGNLPLLMAYGFGDGGGGPTREMLENVREMAALPATPQIHPGSVRDFFRQLEAAGGDRLPTWNGELYLELHRGAYTTQSRNKRANRKSEFLLHDAEFLAACASVLDSNYPYPHDALYHAWELVCLNQFHDIIPGSSVSLVYAESQQQYAEIRALGESVRDAALDVIARQTGGDVLIVNPTSFPRHDLAFWPGGSGELRCSDGAPVLTQAVDGGLLIDAGELLPFSITPLVVSNSSAPNPQPLIAHLIATPVVLENDLLRIELDQAGDIVRIYDKANRREVLPTGAIANQFLAFEDRPMTWDAWDVDIYYDDRVWLAEPTTSVRVIEAGPLRAALEVRRRILHSEYVQRISLAHTSARLDFDTTIDWRERHIMLKVAFPVDILSPLAAHEIQWGNVQRPTHRNTSWDWARFETCAHKWVDLSEGDYGVSLLNDCKYGHDIHDNVMRISLLRSPTTPDPQADQGEHRFAYSLLPHIGSWGEMTVAAAYALNDPIIVVHHRTPSRAACHTPFSLISVDHPNLVIETVKRAQDGIGLIVRLYESQRRRGMVTLNVGFESKVWRTNLLEENQEQLLSTGASVSFFVRPYEIVTLRLVPT